MCVNKWQSCLVSLQIDVCSCSIFLIFRNKGFWKEKVEWEDQRERKPVKEKTTGAAGKREAGGCEFCYGFIGFYIIHICHLWYVFILTLWHMLLQQEEVTPEDQLAEKIRVKKLQEDADLELAKDAFGKTLPFT